MPKYLPQLVRHQVYKNLRAVKTDLTPEETRRFREEKAAFAAAFKEKYGYKPTRSDCRDALADRWPKKYHVSIQALINYDGTLFCVSHDRYFIDKFATRIWAFENGSLTDYRGSYAEYAAWKQRQASYQAADRSADGSAPRKKQERPRTGSPEKQLQRVEKEISRLEEQLQLLEEESAKYGSDYQKLMELDAQKEALNDMLMEQYERWEALSNG